jgi:hypothetical protein
MVDSDDLKPLTMTSDSFDQPGLEASKISGQPLALCCNLRARLPLRVGISRLTLDWPSRAQ